MISLSGVIPYLYMAAYIVIGWRLFTIRWNWRLKLLSGAAMIIAPPLLFILPALRNRQGEMAGLLIATGIGMFVMGLLCALGGALGAYLRSRPRGK